MLSVNFPPTPASPGSCIFFASSESQDVCAMQSASIEATRSLRAACMAVLRAAARPLLTVWWISLTPLYAATISAELSREPSSITRISSGSKVCASRLSMERARNSPALWAGMYTLTLGAIPDAFIRKPPEQCRALTECSECLRLHRGCWWRGEYSLAFAEGTPSRPRAHLHHKWRFARNRRQAAAGAQEGCNGIRIGRDQGSRRRAGCSKGYAGPGRRESLRDAHHPDAH